MIELFANIVNGVVAAFSRQTIFAKSSIIENRLLFSQKQLSPVIRQKGEFQSKCCRKRKQARFFEKRTFLTP